MAAVYINDTTMPILRTFTVDMNQGILSLTFDETVNISTFRTSELTLVDARGVIVSNYTIMNQGEIFTDDDSPVISLRLSEVDLNAIKFDQSIFVTSGTSFLTLTSDTVIDMSGNVAMFRGVSMALEVSTYLPDVDRPNLLNFTLDLNSSRVALTFDEPVSADFNPAVITLLNADEGNFTRSYQLQGVRDSEIFTNLGTVVSFGLSTEDQNELKAFEDFATESANTFLGATSALITDRNRIGLMNNPINASLPLRARAVISDEISPVLVELTRFDLSEGFFRLLFNEPVNASSIAYDRITILDSSVAPPTNERVLVGGETSYVENTLRTEIEVQFSPDDLLAIKLNNNLATSESNTFVQLSLGAILDQTGNEVLASPALQVDRFVRDTSRPRVTSFTLDMDDGHLLLTFDDVVRNEQAPGIARPIEINFIALQSDATGISQDRRVGLTQPNDHSDITNSTDGYETLIFIPLVDLNRLKATENLATNINNTYLTITADTIDDFYGNGAEAIVTTDAQRATTFIPDRTSPELLSFELDIDGAGSLVLSFSETVELGGLNQMSITLVGNNSETLTIISSSFFNAPLSSVVNFFSLEGDLNSIKSLPNLATDSSNTFLAISSDAINDTSGNPVREISISTPLPVSAGAFVSDTTRPELDSFELDLNEGALIFTFSETVNGSSFDPREITVTNDEVSPTESYSLTGGDWEPNFSNILRLNFSVSDLNNLKRIIDLADDMESTFVSLSATTVRDMESESVSNSIVPIENFEGHQAADFFPDITAPELVSFSLDLNSEILILTFDETVNVPSLNIDLITIQSQVFVNTTTDAEGSGSGSGSGLVLDRGSGLMSGSGLGPDEEEEEEEDADPVPVFMSTTLTFGSENSSFTRSANSTVVTINLGPDDLNDLKRQTGLATSTNDTYISFPGETIADMSGNLVEAISQVEPLRADDFMPDMMPPSLVRFDLNLTSETILLTFSEVVNASSLDVTQFTLVAGAGLVDVNRTLSSGVNGSTSSDIDSTEIIVYLGADDLNEIKRLTDLGTSVTNSYLVFTDEAVRDMNTNQVEPVASSDPVRVSLYMADVISPDLVAFNLDVNLGLLTLEFSETVNAASLNVTGFTLHSAGMGIGNQSYTLTANSSTASSDGTRIIIRIGRDDLNAIKYRTELAQDEESTYLEVVGGSILDMNSNFLSPVSELDSIPVSTYVSDISSPVLLSFELDLTAEVLTLNFDETVNVSSLVTMLITLQSSLASSSARYTLASGSVLHDNSPTVMLRIDFHDLNQLKLNTELATGFANTFLSIGAGAVYDLSGEPNPSSPAQLSLAPSDFTPDVTDPRLLSFSANLNLERLTLNFDEPVNASSLDATGITLLDGPGGVSYTLTAGDTPSMNGLQIVVNFTDEDLNRIKEIESLLVSDESSFISITQDLISDMSRNPVTPIRPEEALNTSMLVNDTTRPQLRSFDLDLNSDIMTLEFVETVNTSSINFSGIVLQQAATSSNFYRLMSGTLLSQQDSTIVRFRFTRDDLNAIKSQRIALSSNSSWLTLDEDAIFDQSDRPVVPLENGLNALQVRNYTDDRVEPILESFVLDLNTDILTLLFSETVNVRDTFDIGSFTLISEPPVALVNNPTSHVLGLDVNNTITFDIYEPVVTVQLGRLDLNQLKEDTRLATNRNDTYLFLSETAVSDMRDNTVVPINILMPQQVATYIQDQTPPVLERFDLNMDLGTLTMYFSESINPTTFDITQFTLQHAQEAIAEYAFSFTGSVILGDNPASPTPVLVLDLPVPDLNEIKRISQLATSRADTYIRATEGGLRDMNGNFLQRIREESGLQVEMYSPDITGPNLVNFDLNLSTERLILTFDETVDSSSWSQSGFVIQNSAFTDETNAASRVLIGGEVLTPDDTVVMIQLDAADLNYIKSILDLATSEADTFLRLDNSSIVDMAGNMVSELVNGRAVRVRNYTADDQDPILLSFELDLDSGTMLLTFNETVDTSSLAVEEMTLLSAMSSSTGFVFNASSGTRSLSPDQPVILVEIGDNDLNEIKRRTMLATNANNTFLSLSAGAISDTNRNQVVPVTLAVSSFTEDTTPPTLAAFSFDLDAGELDLTFSETVRGRTLNLTEITLQSEVSESTSTSSYSLTGGTLLTVPDSVSLLILLSKFDLDSIKAIRPLAMSRYSTFVSLMSLVVQDMNENSLIEVGRGAAMMANSFVPDTTSPELESYELDMNIGELVFTFSETVDTLTLNFAQFTLQDGRLVNSTFQFQTSGWSMVLQPVVTVIFSKMDLDLLKENRQVGTGMEDTFISATNLTILDTSGNGLIPIPDGMGLQVRRYVRDSTPPELELFNLDVDSGLLTLFYSETIDIFSLDPTKVTLQNQAYLGTSTFTLTGGDVTPIDSTVGFVQLTIDDLNELKRLINVGTCVRDDTYLSLISNLTLSNTTALMDPVLNISNATSTSMNESSGSGFFSGSGSGDASGMDLLMMLDLDLEFSTHVLDMAGNPVVSIHEETALQVAPSGCTQDTTRPNLVDFTLNLHNSTLILTFDETVNTSTLDLPELTFHNGEGDPTQLYQLTSGYTNTEALSGMVVIEVVLSNTDLNELKRRENLATSANNTRVAITMYLVLDMNWNRNVEIPAENSSEVAVFIPDERQPILLSFELDMTLERLTLSFSETVNASSLNIEGVTILNENFTSSRTLVGGYVLNPSEGGSALGPNDPILIVQLDQDDLNYIKSITDLATEAEDTFIAIQTITVADMSNNFVEEISEFAPLQVSRYVRDEVEPELVSFDLDINSGELFLTFSETVNVSSLDVSAITLQNEEAASVIDMLSFTPGNTSFDTFSVSPDWPIILIMIGSDDLNEIKRLTQLATSNFTTYLTLTSSAVSDMSGNAVVGIENGNATQVSVFTPDTTEPNLLFFSLDLNTGSLLLTFDETVDFSSLNFTSFTIQNASDIIYNSSVSLTGGEITNINDNTTVEILLDILDENEVKRIRSLATSVENTYLSLLSGSILDMNGNPVIEVNDTDAMQASSFMEDLTDPTLVAFELDIDSGMMRLIFDETVEADSVNLTQITLQDGAPASVTNNTYMLTGGQSSNDDSTVIVVTFSFFDLNEIKKLRSLATQEDDSYISITNLTVVDMNENPVEEVPNEGAIQVSIFVNDTTSPILYSFDLDMNLGRIFFNFSETVDAMTFNITQFTLQSQANVSDISVHTHTLTQENLLTGDEVVIIQGLLYFDLNTIKSIPGLATSEDDTFLAISEYAIRDMNGNQVVPISDSDARPVNNYTTDITKPFLVTFDLDMDIGELVLTFSETVNISTLDVAEILLLNDALNATQAFSLTSNSTSSSDDWPIFEINIGDSDLNTLKRMLTLAVSSASTFIQLTENVIRDAAGNMNLPLNATAVQVFIEDTTSPALRAFNLDLSRDVLTLTFSETVSGRTLMANQLTLISGRIVDEESASGSGSGSGSGLGDSGSGLDMLDEGPGYLTNYTLTGGENLPLTIDNTVLAIRLNFEDRNEIKRLTDLATLHFNTFLSITSDFIEDTNTNSITPIDFPEALPVQMFTPDRIPPFLMSFDLDMDTRLLTLSFSETVNVESLNVTQITFQGESLLFDGVTQFYALTDLPAPFGSYSESENSSVIVVRIGETDANEIKFRTDLASRVNNTFVSLTHAAIQDMNGNMVAEIERENATRVAAYAPDASPPVLRNFALNLTSERLSLTFDETVDFESIQPSLVTIQSSLSNDSTTYRLIAAEPIGENSPILVLNLTATQRDLNGLKLLSDLATGVDNTFVTLTAGAILDLSEVPNPILTVSRQVDSYFPDVTSPEVVGFSVNVNASTLTLMFDEVVNASSLDPTAIRLQNSSSTKQKTDSFVDLTGKSGVQAKLLHSVLVF